MSYEKTLWSNGDIITAEKLNKLENGVASNAIMFVDVIEGTNHEEIIDLTWRELKDIFSSGNHIIFLKKVYEDGAIIEAGSDGSLIGYVSNVFYDDDFLSYYVNTSTNSFSCDSEDEHPIKEGIG